MKKGILLIVALAAIMTAIVFTNASKPKTENAYVVNVGVLPIPSSKLPFVIADEQGFFREAGVQVKMTELQSSNLVNDALVRGDVDVTPQISVLPFLKTELISAGHMKIFSVTDLVADAPFDSLIIKSDSQIETLKGLEGKKIGVFPGTTAMNLLKLFFKSKDIDAGSMQFVQLAPPQQPAALASGSVDALFAYEPLVSISLTDGTAKKLYGSVYAEQVNHNPIGTGLLSATFIQTHPKEAANVVAALDKAYDYLRSHSAESRTIEARLFSLTPEAAKLVSLPTYVHSEHIDTTTVEQLLTLFVASGELASHPDVSHAYYQP